MFTQSMLQTLGSFNWLRFGVRDRIIRFAHHPDTSRSKEFVVNFFGAKYRGNFDTYIDWSVFYYGAYAREELRLIEDFLETLQAPVFVDVGANVGHHTLFAALRAEKVFAFEPLEEVANKLNQKVSDNKLSNVVLFKYALGERNEDAVYSKPDGHNSGTGSFMSKGVQSETVILPIRVGDEALANNNIHKVDFIKIDTEGFEPFVLNGLKKSLTHSRPLVFFEWTQGERESIRKSYSGLFPENYRIYHFMPDVNTLMFFRKPNYQLNSVSGAWPDGNLLAIPNEYIERLKIENPGSNAAKRLGLN